MILEKVDSLFVKRVRRMPIQLGRKSVGDGTSCFITFEAGPTHDGLRSAKELVELAGRAGADAVKFQIIDPDRLVADKTQLFSYEVLLDRETGVSKTITEPLYDILKRRMMTPVEWKEVGATAKAHGLAFFATVSFPDELELLASIGCDSVKIASADINHFPLIKLAAETGMCIQIDTGSSSLAEIECAVDVILSTGNEKIIIHHCPSGYPARIESIHLKMIKTLKAMFPFPIAFSDHSPGWDMDIAALVLGANLLEKTITQDRTTPSVEHIFSLDGPDMKRFVEAIHDVERAIGESRRVLPATEIAKRNMLRRSMFATNRLRAGEVVKPSDIDFRRPGTGIQPDLLNLVEGQTLKCDVAQGEMFSFQHFEY